MENTDAGTNIENSMKNGNTVNNITNNTSYSQSSCIEPQLLKKMVPKRKTLSLKQKGAIIEEHDKNPRLSKVKLAEKFQLAISTLSTILANRDAILKTIAKCGAASSKRKNSRSSPYQYLEEKLLDWIIDRQEKGIPINNVIIREQARMMAVDLGIEKFTASSGWIDRFKNRHGLGSKAVFDETVAECKNRWASIRDTFPETTEPRKRQKTGEVPYTQSIYDADNLKLLETASTEKTSSHLMPLGDSTWSADYIDFPDQGRSNQEPNINFPEIKVEVDSLDEEDKTDGNDPTHENGNCDYPYIVPNSLCELATETKSSVSKKRTFAESEEDVVSTQFKSTECKSPEHPIETFFKSMAATVLTFPPHLMAVAKLNVCKLITELELRALTEKDPFDGSQDRINELLSENILGISSTNSVSVENGATNQES